jgi:hypothetical protein
MHYVYDQRSMVVINYQDQLQLYCLVHNVEELAKYGQPCQQEQSGRAKTVLTQA